MAYRYFAVDVGDKRVGLAVSDALGITAQGIETYNRTGDDEKDGEYIRKCAERYAPCRIVFGMPRNMVKFLGLRVNFYVFFNHNIAFQSVNNYYITDVISAGGASYSLRE